MKKALSMILALCMVFTLVCGGLVFSAAAVEPDADPSPFVNYTDVANWFVTMTRGGDDNPDAAIIANPKTAPLDTLGEGIVVAVLDTGSNFQHPEFRFGNDPENLAQQSKWVKPAEFAGPAHDGTGTFTWNVVTGYDEENNPIVAKKSGTVTFDPETGAQTYEYSEGEDVEYTGIEEYTAEDYLTNPSTYNLSGYLYAPNGSARSYHGVHCAGIVGMALNNVTTTGTSGSGVGVAPLVKIMPVRIFQGLDEYYLDFAAAIRYAVDNGANVMTMSVGGDECNPILWDAFEYAYEHGVVMIAAAANEGNDIPMWPAAYPTVISVANVTSTGSRSSSSSYGGHLRIAAPGSSIYSANGTTGISSMSGTSMASPNAAGIAAAIEGYFKDIFTDPDQEGKVGILYNLLFNGGDLSKVSTSGSTNKPYYFGYGLAQLANSILLDPVNIDELGDNDVAACATPMTSNAPLQSTIGYRGDVDNFTLETDKPYAKITFTAPQDLNTYVCVGDINRADLFGTDQIVTVGAGKTYSAIVPVEDGELLFGVEASVRGEISANEYSLTIEGVDSPAPQVTVNTDAATVIPCGNLSYDVYIPAGVPNVSVTVGSMTMTISGDATLGDVIFYVHKADADASVDTALTGLFMDGRSVYPTFNSATTEYTIMLWHVIHGCRLQPTKSDPNAVVIFGDENGFANVVPTGANSPATTVDIPAEGIYNAEYTLTILPASYNKADAVTYTFAAYRSSEIENDYEWNAAVQRFASASFVDQNGDPVLSTPTVSSSSISVTVPNEVESVSMSATVTRPTNNASYHIPFLPTWTQVYYFNNKVYYENELTDPVALNFNGTSNTSNAFNAMTFRASFRTAHATGTVTVTRSAVTAQGLKDAIAAGTAIDGAPYTAASYGALQTAITAGNTRLTSFASSTTQAQVDTAEQNILNAIAALQYQINVKLEGVLTAGATAQVPVSIEGAQALAGTVFVYKYDPAVLSFTGFDKNNAFGSVVVSEPEAGTIKIVTMQNNGISESPIAYGVLNFDILTATADTQVTLDIAGSTSNDVTYNYFGIVSEAASVVRVAKGDIWNNAAKELGADGKIDPNDELALLDLLTEKITTEDPLILFAADVDGNGVIDIADVIALMNLL